MNTRETFGKYLLLMKLSEDPLGEAFRAGRGGRQGLESVLLLRAFNGPSLDTARLGGALAARKEVQSTLKSPNIGNGVEVGQVSGVPYAAYDYISGKNLVTLLEQATSAGSPFPTDHALLVADRIGFALTAAYETRHEGERVHHGMVVPTLVMISNEGETRLLGFEMGPGLAEQAGKLPEEIQRYLAPEARAGAAPSAANDVFSLGAILFELLTGRPLPLLAPQGYGAIVDQVRMGGEDAPLPQAIAALLKGSLAPADARIPDPASWHKALAKVMADGGYNATTFNLAFYMHNIFRDDIERESQEIEAEKTLAPAAAGVAVGAAGGAETIAISRDDVASAAAPTPATGEVRTGYGIGQDEEEPGASKKGLWIGLAAAILVAVLGTVGYLLYARGAQDTPEQVAEIPPADPAEVAAPAEPDAAAAQLQAQIDAMLDEKTSAMEASLKEKYDERIAAMQKQLQQAEAAAAERARRQEESRAAAKQPEETASEPVQEVLPAPGQSRPAGGDSGAAGGAKAVAAPPTGADTIADDAGAAAPAPEPQPPAPKPAPAPVPQEPQVRVGELVSHGPGVVSPRVTRRGTPSFPPIAARLNKEATVDVQVLVDETGKVVETKIDGRKAGFGFDDEALEAARASTFEPATKFGVKVKMWTTMRFVFKR